MIELDRKLLDLFQGFVVRKDIVRAVKVGANVPVFVLEYLLANSCSTDDEEKNQGGSGERETCAPETLCESG